MNLESNRVTTRMHLLWTATILVLLASGGTIPSLGAMVAAPKQLSASTIAARRHYFGAENVDAKTGAVRRDRVILSWIGVSSFAASFNGHVVLLDGWIPRGAPCFPHLEANPEAR